MSNLVTKGCHISQKEVNMAKQPLKVQQPPLESSSEVEKLRHLETYNVVEIYLH